MNSSERDPLDVDLGDRYELLEELGAGGMGRVYKARDRALKRNVAIKLLAPRLTDDIALSRFRREAEMLAAVDHPGVATIHSIEAAGPTPFLVMELVGGETLAERLARGPLPLRRSLEIARQIADALSAAHESGIVHRDVKPGNVLIGPEGRVKIVDFGLARPFQLGRGPDLTQRSTELARLTEGGGLVGTAPYMSPEQVRGHEVDRRADVWAFGCILFEALSGRRAFARETVADTLAAILEHEPEWTALPQTTPPSIRSLLERCLHKDPHDRLHDLADARVEIDAFLRTQDAGATRQETTGRVAGERTVAPQPAAQVHRFRPRAVVAIGGTVLLIVALLAVWSEIGTGSGPPAPAAAARIGSLAVLPFDNLMNDPEQDFFVEGMHEALITDLSKVDTLRLISRTSVMRYRDTQRSLPEIAEELGVDALIEGSVLRSGERVRITAQLIDGKTDEHLWAESYDRDLDNVLVLLNEVAREIASQVQITLTPGQRELLTSAGAVDPAAHEAYLRGQYFYNRGSVDDFRAALPLFERAVQLEPSFARAWSSLAATYVVHGFFGIQPAADMVPKIREAANEALRLDRGQGPAHGALGRAALFFDWDWATARRELEQALALDPTNTDLRHAYADFVLFVDGDCEASLRQMRLSHRYDPMGPLGNLPLLMHTVHCGHYEDGIAEGERLRQLFPDRSAVPEALAMAYWQLGRYDEAIAEYRRAWGEESPRLADLERGYAERGPRGAMLELANRLAEQATRGNTSPFGVASYFAAAQEHDRAFEWLDRAFEARTPQLLQVRSDPRFDSLRADPRYGDLIERIGLPAL